MLWMLWLVPAAIAAGLSSWVDGKPEPRRASWEMDLRGRGWSRGLTFAATFFTFMAGAASTDSAMPAWVRVAVIVVAIGAPLGAASVVSKRRRKATSMVAGRD